ncbi:DUF4365 domain-containing protein [Paenibacillus senegalensis]|uniref:DUF4365 domain-containing protein n=1 Tax=Paenibacillus senegalensis TaxID=1465766 RepID=UPI000287AF4E|nr:DUF4365 domain-containing protein [Paenibacillus senegalensis]
MKKEITAYDSFFTGATGEAIIQSIFSRWKISTTKISESDFGEDFLCDIFLASEDGKTNIRTNLTFRVQVKTTKQISKEGYIRKTKKGFSFSLGTALLELWIESYYPVILVIWDLKENCGYWCAPLQEYNSSKLPDTETATIHFNKEMLLENSESKIKDYVQHYYNGLLNIGDSQYQCYIYPIWMPKYRVFTAFEIMQFFKQASTSTIKQTIHVSNFLPSFLASYNNINLDGGLPCIQYIGNADSLSSYVLSLKKYLSETHVELTDDSWIAFIVSPIEIIQAEYRVINKMTDWISFSLINKQLVTDREYSFELGNDYYYTRKVRASSSDQDLFIHSSGDFAVEVFATGFSLASRKAGCLLNKKYYTRALCIWDVSNCEQSEKEEIEKWCHDNNYTYNILEDDLNIVVIAHENFSKGSYGIMLPGAITWSEFDKGNLSDENITAKIPYGTLANSVDAQKVLNVYLDIPDKITEEVFIKYGQMSSGEVLNHRERLIQFISYIHPLDNKKFERHLEEVKKDFERVFLTEEISFELFVDFYDGLANLILNIKPSWNVPTNEIIEFATPLFIQIFEEIQTECHQRKNMAYYIKYRLDRFLPEELVKFK